MKKKASVLLGLLGALALASCGSNASSEGVTLRVYNWEDYISEDPSVIEMFEEYVKEKDGVDITVIYDTFDTNETMLSQLETGASTYDLICPSDYMIQRMATNGMLEPFKSGDEKRALYTHNSSLEDWPDYYEDYTSSYLKGRFEEIKVSVDGISYPLSSYARGYMWGTLGLIYNPDWFENRGISSDEVKVDMYDWNSLWDEKYHGAFQIKDSMRDTYAVGIMHGYDEEFQELLSLYEDGSIDADSYNERLNILFNNVVYPLGKDTSSASDEEIHEALLEIENHMGEVLMQLKDNSYGLEVDSGKQDIVAQRTGIGIAWSGDAVWSMDLGDNEEGISLYYSVPETGANIWFDGWVMPKSDDLNQEYAQKFVDFLANPEVASLNMSTIGYTSFSGGDLLIDLIREWYDPRSYAMYPYVTVTDVAYWDYGDFLYNILDEDDPLYKEYNDGSLTYVGYLDFETDIGTQSLPVEIYYGEEEGVDMFGSSYETPIIDGVESTWEEYQEATEWEWTVRDLSWFFDSSTLDEYTEADAVFYTDEIESYETEDGKEFEVGRQFYAQYPSEEMLPCLAVMEDYGSNNSYVLRMWEDVKAGPLEIWVVVCFSIIVALALGAGIYAFLSKKRKLALRKQRRAERKA